MKIDSCEIDIGWTKYKDLMGLIFAGEETKKHEDQNNERTKDIRQTGCWGNIRGDYDIYYEVGDVFEIY